MGFYSDHYRTRNEVTSQKEQADERQKKNNAGGYSFVLDKWSRLERFLILGTEGGTYYVSEKTLTVQNAKSVRECIEEDGIRVVDTIVSISEEGRAAKNDPALYALAMCAGLGDENTRKYALKNLPKVARIGTHLFHFAEYVEAFRGWGRGLKRAVSAWYTEKSVEDLTYQVIKYQQRDGWSHKDLIRLSHPTTEEHAKNAIFRWVRGGMEYVSSTSRKIYKNNQEIELEQEDLSEYIPDRIKAYEEIKSLDNYEYRKAINLILEYRLPREAVPTRFLDRAEVWEALLQDMPLTATIRNLGKMTAVGLIYPNSKAAKIVSERLLNGDYIKRSRVHPITILTALKTYKQGSGFRGSMYWTPVTRVVDALNDSFYLSFKNVNPTDKRIIIGLDVSGSMDYFRIEGSPLSAAEASAALALVTANVESDYTIMAFSEKFKPIDISPKMRLDQVINKIRRLTYGATDCALPMLWAMKESNSDKIIETDAFIIYTDCETYYGNIHPHQALRNYRDKSGIPAKLAVVGMVSNEFTIADPNDKGMLDVVGFDTSTPDIISNFIRE